MRMSRIFSDKDCDRSVVNLSPEHDILSNSVSIFALLKVSLYIYVCMYGRSK